MWHRPGSRTTPLLRWWHGRADAARVDTEGRLLAVAWSR
jgi:hypothetical protein